MHISLPSAAISRGDATAIGNNKSDEPQGKVAKLKAKAAKIQKQINTLAKPKEDDAPDDAQAAKLRQGLIKVLQQQLALIMAEIARLRAEAAKKEEPAPREKEPSHAVNSDHLPLTSSFSITV